MGISSGYIKFINISHNMRKYLHYGIKRVSMLLSYTFIMKLENDPKKSVFLSIGYHFGIDDYLAFCKERNENPEKPFSGKFNLRIDLIPFVN